MPNASAPKDFQGLLLALQTYWAERGCALMQGYDLEVGAGTMNPATFLKVLDRSRGTWRTSSPRAVRPTGASARIRNRLHQHHQYQVILKPSPKDVQGPVSGLAPGDRDHLPGSRPALRRDDWESPTLGAWGLGWEVWCDGMEVTQSPTSSKRAGSSAIRSPRS